MQRVLPLVSALVPLAIAPGLLFYFDVTPKVVVLLLGCAALLWAQLDLTALFTRRRGRLFAALLGTLVVSLLLSTAFSSDPGMSLVGSIWRRYGLLTQGAIALTALAAAANVARDSATIVPVLRATCIAGIATSLYGCFQYFGIDPWLPAAAYHIGEGEFSIVRPPSTLGHASYAASFYLQAIFAGVALALSSPQILWRRLGWLTGALGSVAIVLSGTRGAIVGWVAGFVVLMILLRPTVNAKRLAFAGALLVIGAIFYISPAGEKLRSRTRWSTEDPRGGARLELWRDAAKMGAVRWSTGWGPETFVTEFPHYQSRELARQFPDFYHESPHNIFLESWTAQGLLGLLVLGGLCVLALGSAPASAKQSCLLAGFVALAASLQFVSFTAPTAFGFFLTLALLVALDPPDRQSLPRLIPRLVTVPLCIIAVAYAIQIAASDMVLESSRQLLATGRIADAERVYQRTRSWQWTGPTSDLWFSRALLDASPRSANPVERIASIEIARQSAERATISAEDRHDAFYTLAQIYALREDNAAVERNLRLAIAAAPMWFKPHWTLAEALLIEGRLADALKEAEIAADLDAGKDPEVAETLARIKAASDAARR